MWGVQVVRDCGVLMNVSVHALKCGGLSNGVLHFPHLQLKEFIKSDLMGNVYAAGDQVCCSVQQGQRELTSVSHNPS